jgi:hypothetical protein
MVGKRGNQVEVVTSDGLAFEVWRLPDGRQVWSSASVVAKDFTIVSYVLATRHESGFRFRSFSSHHRDPTPNLPAVRQAPNSKPQTNFTNIALWLRAYYCCFFHRSFFSCFFFYPSTGIGCKTGYLTIGLPFKHKKNNLDIEHRKKLRFGNDYVFTKNIAGFFQKKGIADSVLVFIAPTSYFLANGMDYHVPEPTVFYLHTGLKTIWVQSKDAIKSNWYVYVKDKRIQIDTVPPKPEFIQIIKRFEKYPFVL